MRTFFFFFGNFFLMLLKVQFTPVYGKSTRILVSLKPFDVFTPSLPRTTPLVFALPDGKYLPRVFRDYGCGFLETRQTAAQKKLILRDNFDKRAKCVRRRDFAPPPRSLVVPTSLCVFFFPWEGKSAVKSKTSLCFCSSGSSSNFFSFSSSQPNKKEKPLLT